MDPSPNTLLVCSVGGSPEPIVAAIKHWRPVKLRFVHTPQTRHLVEPIVVQAQAEGVQLDPARYDLLDLHDGQDLALCLERLRQLTPEVEEWVARGDGFRTIVDITGGTKCMSAALALQASRWQCIFSYVGGDERSKDDVGIVVSGTERILHQANPWDSLGRQAVADFVVLFDQGAFVAAARLAERAKKRMTRPDRKAELNVLEQLATAFDDWERFDHHRAQSTFQNVEKAANDLRAVLGQQRADVVLGDVRRLATHLRELCTAVPPSRHHVVDLLANARRRQEEGRIDDGVARLYRAIEAVAQVALRESHAIRSTECVPLDRIPPTLRAEWEQRAKDGVLAVALQDAYALLDALGDPLGAKFKALRLGEKTSPLGARNRSILAHGFERTSPAIFDQLWTATLDLAGVTQIDLPSFPKLARVR